MNIRIQNSLSNTTKKFIINRSRHHYYNNGSEQWMFEFIYFHGEWECVRESESEHCIASLYGYLNLFVFMENESEMACSFLSIRAMVRRTHLFLWCNGRIAMQCVIRMAMNCNVMLAWKQEASNSDWRILLQHVVLLRTVCWSWERYKCVHSDIISVLFVDGLLRN